MLYLLQLKIFDTEPGHSKEVMHTWIINFLSDLLAK